MEACGSAHHWARKLRGLGHGVRLISPQFVKPYVKSNKNDAADAEAICEAVTRPNMRFVPIKTMEQQAVLSVHRVRQGFVKARTAQANQIRGLLTEFGLVLPRLTPPSMVALWRRAGTDAVASLGVQVAAATVNVRPLGGLAATSNTVAIAAPAPALDELRRWLVGRLNWKPA